MRRGDGGRPCRAEGLVGFKRPGLEMNVPDAALLARLVALDGLDAPLMPSTASRDFRRRSRRRRHSPALAPFLRGGMENGRRPPAPRFLIENLVSLVRRSIATTAVRLSRALRVATGHLGATGRAARHRLRRPGSLAAIAGAAQFFLYPVE